MTKRSDGLWEQVAPTHCAAGHDLRGNVRTAWLGCSCQGGPGHLAWTCQTCLDVTYDPPHTDPGQATGKEYGR